MVKAEERQLVQGKAEAAVEERLLELLLAQQRATSPRRRASPPGRNSGPCSGTAAWKTVSWISR